MTLTESVKNSRKNKKLINYPPESLSPKKTAKRLKKKVKSKKDDELSELFSSKWTEIKKLKLLELESGKTYKKGKFSKIEEQIVRNKVSEYLKDHDISEEDFKEAFFNQKGRKQFKKIFIQVAKSLPGGRPVITVYHFMRRIYHPGNRQGLWLPEEDLHLRRLFATHGPQWEIISQELGRFNHSCRDRYRWIREQFNKGPWNLEETQKLKQAIEARKMPKSTIDNDYSIGAWAWISEQVETRSWHQCLSKWTNSLSFKEKHPGQKNVRWSKEQDLILLNKIYDLVVVDESEIVWSKLIDDGWNVWTPMRIRMRWKLLRRRVRNEKILDMDTIVETILNNISILSPEKHTNEDSDSDDTQMMFDK